MSTSTQDSIASGLQQLEQLAHIWINSGRLNDYLLNDEESLLDFESCLKSRNSSLIAQEFITASREFNKSQHKSVHWLYQVVPWAIDVFLIFMLLTYFISLLPNKEFFWTRFFIIYTILHFVYFCLSYRLGKTLGLWLAGLRVVSETGKQLSWKRAAARAMLNWIFMANILTKTHISLNTSSKIEPISVQITLAIIKIIQFFFTANILFVLWCTAIKDSIENDFLKEFMKGYFENYVTSLDNLTADVAGQISGHLVSAIIILSLLRYLVKIKKLIWFRILSGFYGIYYLPSPFLLIVFFLSFRSSFIQYFSPVSPDMQVFLKYQRDKAARQNQK
jgi:uncharacterized RDD family membrane protein YckC